MKSLTSNVSELYATMPCGEFTGKIKPKHTENWKIIVAVAISTPGKCNFCKIEIIIGIMAAANAVAEAKPK